MWSKREAKLPHNIKIHGSVLKITKITPENHGVYICEAVNDVGRYFMEILIEVESKYNINSINFPCSKIK